MTATWTRHGQARPCSTRLAGSFLTVGHRIESCRDHHAFQGLFWTHRIRFIQETWVTISCRTDCRWFARFSVLGRCSRGKSRRCARRGFATANPQTAKAVLLDGLTSAKDGLAGWLATIFTQTPKGRLGALYRGLGGYGVSSSLDLPIAELNSADRGGILCLAATFEGVHRPLKRLARHEGLLPSRRSLRRGRFGGPARPGR